LKIYFTREKTLIFCVIFQVFRAFSRILRARNPVLPRVASLFRMKITENVKFCKDIKVRGFTISAKMLEIMSKERFGIGIA
jgi:hypothetical protein